MERDPADTAAILYTGGTTGTPKGVMLTHEGISISSYSVAHFERSTETDRAMCFMPFNHVFGQIHIMNATIFSAGCLELLPSFDIDRVMEAIEAGRITKLYAVPTIYIRLLALGDLEKRLGDVYAIVFQPLPVWPGKWSNNGRTEPGSKYPNPTE